MCISISLSLSIYIYIYIYISLSLYIYIYTYVHTYLSISLSLSIHIYICIHVCIYIYIYIYMYIRGLAPAGSYLVSGKLPEARLVVASRRRILKPKLRSVVDKRIYCNLVEPRLRHRAEEASGSPTCCRFAVQNCCWSCLSLACFGAPHMFSHPPSTTLS